MAPESIRALSLFPHDSHFKQSETSVIVNRLGDDCPLHSSESSSLLKEGFSVTSGKNGETYWWEATLSIQQKTMEIYVWNKKFGIVAKQLNK